MDYLKGITAIVFDLGGVIVDLDIDKSRNQLSSLLGIEQPQLYYSNHHIPLFSDYEIGNISSTEFVDGLLKQSVNGTTRENIISAWNSMLVDIPVRRVKMLEKLGESYRLFVLSNTNSIHVDRFENMAPGYNKLSELFESVYYSHLIGYRKPDKRAFEAVVNGSKLEVAKTLFIDDLEANIDAAALLGFKILHIKSGMDVADFF